MCRDEHSEPVTEEALEIAAACGDPDARAALGNWTPAPTRVSKWGTWLGKKSPEARIAGLVALCRELPATTVPGRAYAYSPDLHARVHAIGEVSQNRKGGDPVELLDEYLVQVAGPDLRGQGQPLSWELLAGHVKHRWRRQADGGRRVYHRIVLAFRAALLGLPDDHLAFVTKSVEALSPGSLEAVRQNLASWAVARARSGTASRMPREPGDSPPEP